MRPRRLLLTIGLTAAASLVLAAPASAHPFFRDADQVPANSLTTLTLAMAHGCGTESEGGGDPTLEVAVEVHETFSFVEPIDEDGYTAQVETDDDGQPVAMVWTATDGGEPAPDVAFDVVVDGQPGDEVYVRVFQGCEDFEYRWIGTPDEPAEDPAVRLVLSDPDPDSPPPTPGDDAPGTDADAGDVVEDEVTDDADGTVDDPDAELTEAPDAPTEVDEAGVTEEDGFPWVPLVVVLVVVVILGGVLAYRTRQRGEPGDGGPAGTGPDAAA